MSVAAAAQEATPSSSSDSPSSSSSSDDDDVDDPDYHLYSSDDEYRATTLDNHKDNAAADVIHPMPTDAEGIFSNLRTQDDVDAVCKKYGVPKGQYAAHPAGDDLRASSSPPPGAVCLYAHALEAGMRVPLHPFFCDALTHFGIAPTQLAPNGWRVMAGFVVLCHFAGVPPSLPTFRHFFTLRILDTKKKGPGWCTFHCKDGSGLRFAGLPDSIKGWKHSFFFLSSPTPWAFPVEWAEPCKSSLVAPVLTGQDKKSVSILLRVHGGAPVDIRLYLLESILAKAMISPASPPLMPLSPPPPPLSPSCTPTSVGPEGMDHSVYSLMKTILAEKAAATQASASAYKVKSEPDMDAPSRGKKRRLEEAEGSPSCAMPNTQPAAHGSPPPPGFPRMPRHFTSRHDDDDDDTTDWEAARALLRGAVAPQQERVFAASRPSDVVARCHVAVLKAVNYASFSIGYAQKLEQKLAARDAEVAALQSQLEKTKAKLAAMNAASI